MWTWLHCECVCTCLHTHCAGVADVVSVGCVYIGESTSRQVAQFTSTDVGQPPNQPVDPLISTIDYELYTERLEECNAVFDTVNPQTPSYKTVVIRNYRSALHPNICMPFVWLCWRCLSSKAVLVLWGCNVQSNTYCTFFITSVCSCNSLWRRCIVYLQQCGSTFLLEAV